MHQNCSLIRYFSYSVAALHHKEVWIYIYRQTLFVNRFFFLICFLSNCFFALAQSQRFQYMQPKMGSPFHIIFYAEDTATATGLAQRSFQLVDSLNIVFSDYLDTSELNRLSATAGKDSFVSVSPILFDILKRSQQAWKKSEGSFDITIGPLSKVWRRARKEKKFSEEGVIREAKAKVGFDKVLIDTSHHRVKLTQAGMQLDLGGIAQGFAAQQVIDFLQSKGIHSALVNASGDIVCSDAPPGKNGWTIGVNLPHDADDLLDRTIVLDNKAVSTSGDVYQFMVHEGKRYSHIIDPRTGYGVTFQRNVTVIAPQGTSADWLATACSILPIRKAKKLVKEMNAVFLITQIRKGKLRIYTSKGMTRYWKK
jgi:FAD:protein FMN transferase